MAAHRQLVEALTVGDEVVITGGIFGTIRGMEGDRIELEVAPGVAITVARVAIAQSANPVAPPGVEPAADEPHTDNGPNDD